MDRVDAVAGGAIAGRFSLRMLREALAGLLRVLRERAIVPPRVSTMVGRVLGMRT